MNLRVLLFTRAVTAAPIPRIGAAEELEGVALLPASDAPSYIAGQTIAVDGESRLSRSAAAEPPLFERVYQSGGWAAALLDSESLRARLVPPSMAVA